MRGRYTPKFVRVLSVLPKWHLEELARRYCGLERTHIYTNAGLVARLAETERSELTDANIARSLRLDVLEIMMAACGISAAEKSKMLSTLE